LSGPARVTHGELRLWLMRSCVGEGGRLLRGAELLSASDGTPVPAAVLVPVIGGERPAVLLTKRTERLRRHAGQVSFPGGRIDPMDADATAAALREAAEEVGLDPAQVEVVGRFGDFLTGTAFRITPVVGLLPEGLTFRPDPGEVEAVFELPLQVLLDPDAPRRVRQERDGVMRDFWVWPHSQHYIWGATAAILVHLAERLRDAA
jgi:8-oxo-dGTP pyrophosphatase MutT (NUDIX family)